MDKWLLGFFIEFNECELQILHFGEKNVSI